MPVDHHKPFLSIITVVLNDAENLKKTLDSISSEIQTSFECILIDGGSKDNTLDVAGKRSFLFSEISSEPDNGIYDAMNKGIRLAKGRYISFMNAGDVFVNPYIIDRVFDGTSKEADIIYGDSLADYSSFTLYKKARPHNALWKGMAFCHQSSFVRTQLLKDEPFDTHFGIAADYDFFCKMLKQGKTFRYCDFPFAIYSSDGISNDNIYQNALEQYKVFRQYHSLGIQWCLRYCFVLGFLGILVFMRRLLPLSLYKALVRFINKRHLVK